ncbi:MAG: M56 family metallopeptidase [Colwellia sp.]|nr:M56 family metallopeptidase [Colwellia sp.]
MIEGQLALWLNIVTIVILAFVIANFTVSTIVSLLAQKFINLQVKSRKIVLWLLVTLPWLSSICVALYFLRGYTNSTVFQSEAEYAHWHHMDIFNWLSWHGATLIIALVFTVYILGKKLIQLKRHHKDLANLASISKPLSSDVIEIELPESSAFTAGFINKKCFITSGMLKEMTAEEVAVVLGHERAHAKMNDPLKKWLFSIFTAFFIPSLAAHLKLHMTLAMEQAADNAVVNSDIAPTFVASTLVKAARLNALYSPVKNNELVANFGADVLEQRVYFLLGQLNLKPVNKMLTAILVTFILAVCLSSIDGVHHLIETVLSH